MASLTKRKTPTAMASMMPLIVWAQPAPKALLGHRGRKVTPDQWVRPARLACRVNKARAVPKAPPAPLAPKVTLARKAHRVNKVKKAMLARKAPLARKAWLGLPVGTATKIA